MGAEEVRFHYTFYTAMDRFNQPGYSTGLEWWGHAGKQTLSEQISKGIEREKWVAAYINKENQIIWLLYIILMYVEILH